MCHCVTYRKASSTKVIAVGASEVSHSGLPLPSDYHSENVEALLPMISDFIDAKVRQQVTAGLLVAV